MRQDMKEVFREAGRTQGKVPKRSRMLQDIENLPPREGMRRPYRLNWSICGKSGRLNMAPIQRWLTKQVGRSWDDVFQEVCQVADMRSTTGRELRIRILNFVTTTGLEVTSEGLVMEIVGYQGPAEVTGLYVHPITRTLCNGATRTWATLSKDRADAIQLELHARRRILSPTHQLHKVNGIWYSLTMAVPHPMEQTTITWTNSRGEESSYKVFDRDTECVDILSSMPVSRPHWAMKEQYGDANLYAKAKRQLSHKELKDFGLLD
jgi:hypothetical protein